MAPEVVASGGGRSDTRLNRSLAVSHQDGTGMPHKALAGHGTRCYGTWEGIKQAERGKLQRSEHQCRA